MGKEREITIVSSGRNFFPKGAYFYSTKYQQELAEGIGYEGIEFLPTWRVCWETMKYGRLLAGHKFISSLHRDWRFDGVMAARLKGKPGWWFQLRGKADWLFPPSEIALKVLQKLQERYNVPVSVTWFSDTKSFSPVMLELWGRTQGIDQEGLMRWLQESPREHGVVIDTGKIDDWLETNELGGKESEVLRALLPHAFEVHYRSFLEKYPGRLERSKRNLQTILNIGFNGRVVVEFGWPDLENPPFGLIRENLDSFRKLHQEIISFIKTI